MSFPFFLEKQLPTFLSFVRKMSRTLLAPCSHWIWPFFLTTILRLQRLEGVLAPAWQRTAGQAHPRGHHPPGPSPHHQRAWAARLHRYHPENHLVLLISTNCSTIPLNLPPDNHNEQVAWNMYLFLNEEVVCFYRALWTPIWRKGFHRLQLEQKKHVQYLIEETRVQTSNWLNNYALPKTAHWIKNSNLIFHDE